MEEQELIGSCFGVLKCCFFGGFLFCHYNILRVFFDIIFTLQFMIVRIFIARSVLLFRCHGYISRFHLCARASVTRFLGDDSLDVLDSYFTPVPMGR